MDSPKPIFIFIHICDLCYILVSISDCIALIHDDDDVNDSNYDDDDRLEFFAIIIIFMFVTCSAHLTPK